jgi:hypothetical protein
VLEPLIALERALGLGGESRGDLEDIGVSRLLRTIRRLRPDASIVLQDPWSLFEIEMRDGHLARLTRTAIDGAFTRGAEALPVLVGMSSGRFVIVKRVPGADPQESDMLDDAFADATHHLAKMMNALADDPGCRVSFDEDVLGAYVRHSPIGVQRLIARLVDGEAPRALWQSGAGTRSLVDALLITLARQGAIREVVAPEPLPDEQPVETEAPSGGRLNRPQIRQDSAPVADPIERENLRAQSALAMFGQPANRGSRSAHPIWRLGAGAAPGDETLSRFEAELRRKPRLLGFAFIVLLIATTGLLIWREVSSPPAAPPPPVTAPAPAPIEVDQAEAVAEQGVDARPAPSAEPWSGFAGTLKEGVDASLEVSEGQGVLEIDGTSGVRIEVDGIDRGSLPAAIVLDEGRHTVRFETDTRSTTRFYYVKAGATRVLRAVTRPGGFVDPR